MKKIFTLLCCLVFAFNMHAQTSGGPDAYGYTWRNSNDVAGPSFSWYDVSSFSGAVQVSGLGDDNTVGPFLLPAGMEFHYYWYDISKFWVGSNGYVIFTNGQVSSPFPIMPSTALPNDIIAAMMCDITFTDAGSNLVPGAECWYWINNAADSLIVMWDSVPFWVTGSPGYTGRNAFEIIISLVDSSITCMYKYQNGTTQTNDLTIGIENNSGLIGLNPIDTPLPPYVSTNFAIKYYPPASSSFTVNDASAIWAHNDGNGGLFISKNGAPFSMNGEVKNVGNINLSTFNVNAKVTGPVPSVAIKVQDNQTVGPLSTGQSQAVNFTNQFNPNASGTFRYFVLTQVPSDAYLGNDSAKVEIHVVDTTTQSILLTYDNGSHSGDAGGLSWSGGNGGAGMYFIPPYYPCEIDTLRYFIVTNPNGMGFSAKIFDDDGASGAAGTELFNNLVDAVDVDTLAWTYVVVDPPVTINSGGFYVTWIMEGDGIAMGQDRNPPFSNRTFEILGSTWAIYRYRETEDLMMNAIVKGNFGASVLGPAIGNQTATLFPNPSKGKTILNFTKPCESVSEIILSDLNGRIMNRYYAKTGQQTVELNLETLAGGTYFVTVSAGTSAEQTLRLQKAD